MSDAKKYWVHPWESDAPEQIWIWGWQDDSSWQSQTWQHEDEPISTMKYIRADRIEALIAERDDYAHKLMQANNTYTEMHLEIERLSDKLAKAVEVLSSASNMDVTDWSEALDVKNQARATLAELTGGKDE